MLTSAALGHDNLASNHDADKARRDRQGSPETGNYLEDLWHGKRKELEQRQVALPHEHTLAGSVGQHVWQQGAQMGRAHDGQHLC